MTQYLFTAINDETQILAILQEHSPYELSRLTGFILVARAFDDDGTLRTHTLKMEDQSNTLTNLLMEDCGRSVKKKA